MIPQTVTRCTTWYKYTSRVHITKIIYGYTSCGIGAPPVSDL